MSVSHLDAIKKKYGFQTLNVATWRDPKLSVHPARGGPKGPTISPDLAAKPFELTYKVRIKPPPPPPEPTDDEESEGEEEEPSAEPAVPVDLPSEPITETLESNVEGSEGEPPPKAAEPSPLIEDAPESTPAETQPEPSEPNPSNEAVSVADVSTETPADAATAPLLGQSNDQSDTIGSAQTDEVDPSQAIDARTPSDAPVADANQDPAPAPEPPQRELVPDEIVDIVEAAPGSFPGAEDNIALAEPPNDSSTLDNTSIEVPPPAPEPPSSLVEEGLNPDEITAVKEPAAAGEKSPKIVQFAPGTPEPKPTSRKKKMGKGAKNKKKMIIVDASGTSSPDDIIAIEEPAPLPSEPILEVPPHEPATGDEALRLASSSVEPGVDSSAIPEPAVIDPHSAEVSTPVPPPTSEPSNEASDQPVSEEIPKVVIEESTPPGSKSKKKKGPSKQPKDAPCPPFPEPLASDDLEPIIVEAESEPAPADLPKEKSREKKKKKSKGKSKEVRSPPIIVVPAGLGIDLSDVLPDETHEEPSSERATDHAKETAGSLPEGMAQTESVEAEQEEYNNAQPAEETQLHEALHEPSSADQGMELSTSVAEDNPAELKTEAVTSDKSESNAPLVESAVIGPDLRSEPVAETSEAIQVISEESPVHDNAIDAQDEDSGESSCDVMEPIEDSARSDSAIDVDSQKGGIDDAMVIPEDNAVALDEQIPAEQLEELIAWDERLSESESEARSSDGSEVELDTAGDSIDLAGTQDEESLSTEDLKEAESPLGSPSEKSAENFSELGQPVEIQPESGTGFEPLKVIPRSDGVMVAGEPPPDSDNDKEDDDQMGDSALLDESGVIDSEGDVKDDAPISSPMPENSDTGHVAEDGARDSGPVNDRPVGHVSKENAEGISEPEAEISEDTAGASSEPISRDIFEALQADHGGPRNGGDRDEFATEASHEDAQDVGVISGDNAASEPPTKVSSELDGQEHVVELPIQDHAGDAVEESTPEVVAPEVEIGETSLEQADEPIAVAAPESSEEAQGEPGQVAGGEATVGEVSAVPEAQGESETVETPPDQGSHSSPPLSEPVASPGDPAPELSVPDSAVLEEIPLVESIVVEPPKEQPNQDASPSPQLSRSSGSRHKADHWKRDHRKRGSSDSKKSSDKSRSSKPARLPDGLRSTRDRSHRSSLMTAEELVARQKRREERKALEIARIQEEERRLAEEEELRRIRHEARRAARKAAAEEATRLAKEEAEAIARKEAERRRRHREVREIDRPRPRRESKSSSSGIPKLLGFSLGQPLVRTSNNHVKSASRVEVEERPGTSTSRKYMLRDENLRIESPTLPGSSSHGSKEGGSSGHHRRHRHYRTESDRPEPRRRDSERPESGRSDEKRHRRPAAPEQKPKSFLGRLFA
ncbi:hypothetical protein DOTSEDRAFT_70282 [Dothistroma septosporum NZE10]|uniref:Uncharacterized protein n=1 Tax=Dothistroma septosporum (strain NZE10 / CBS 128990) TaxID=675120 RepID=N1PS73_DOTSN|nr:hypothetical protein DOTSEDRAFT_70282 [Dothistroma septosporum NZE10]